MGKYIRRSCWIVTIILMLRSIWTINPVNAEDNKVFFVVRAVLPENQINDDATYFDIEMKPGQIQKMDVIITSTYDETIEVEVSREYLSSETLQYGQNKTYSVGIEDFDYSELTPEQGYKIGDEVFGQEIREFVIRTHNNFNDLNSSWSWNNDSYTRAQDNSYINYLVLDEDNSAYQELVPIALNEDTVNYINSQYLNDYSIRQSLGYGEPDNSESVQPYILNRLRELVADHNQELNQAGYKDVVIETTNADGVVEFKEYKEQTAVFYYNGNPYTTASSSYLADKIREVFNSNPENSEVLGNIKESYVGIRFSPTVVEGKGNAIYITHVAL